MAPAIASYRAMASPMPLLAPVMSTTLFWMIDISVSCGLQNC
jgi:hypothetical protein